MKIRSVILGAAAGGIAMGITLPQDASAAISDEAFNALAELVRKQGQMLEELKQTHQQDQEQIQQLQQQFTGRTYDMWNAAEYKAFNDARGLKCAHATGTVTKWVVELL